MTLVVDPCHWLTPEGEIPRDQPDLRRNVLNVARVVEHGSTVARGGELARRVGVRCQRWWYHSTHAVHVVLTKEYFDGLGVPRLAT